MKKKSKTKYIFVTGGVVSSLGKGIAAASLAAILEARGLNVTITTSANTDEEARALLTALGMPFREEGYTAEERAARRRKKMRKYSGRGRKR